MNKAIKIIFENNDFVILNKPSGLLSIPDRFDESKENLYDLLKNSMKEIFIVHRLDRETSGVICFAKHAESHKVLNDAFESRQIDKRYLAICESSPSEDSGIIDVPISHSQTHAGRMLIHPKGKEATTKYRVKEKWRNFSLLECKPETGRTHQIRVHLQYLECPIICDSFYGKRSSLSIDDLKKHSKLSKNKEGFKPLIDRTALHAHTISFKYKKEVFTFEAEIPKDMKAVINQLSKWQRL